MNAASKAACEDKLSARIAVMTRKNDGLITNTTKAHSPPYRLPGAADPGRHDLQRQQHHRRWRQPSGGPNFRYRPA